MPCENLHLVPQYIVPSMITLTFDDTKNNENKLALNKSAIMSLPSHCERTLRYAGG